MITITKDLLTINPAYNDSIIEYTCTLTGSQFSDIYITGVDLPFRVYPVNGVFTFNFKEIVKVLINQNNFTDSIIPDLDTTFVYDDESLKWNLEVFIAVNNDISSEFLDVSYLFLKNVEQLINYRQKSALTNNIRLLLPTKNYIDYHLTYFDGYPNDFGVYGLNAGNTFYFKNITTINTSPTYTATTSEVKRMFISDGSTNTTITDALELSVTNNRIEMWVNGAFKANLVIKKNVSQGGIYLKWFNASGAYSYWLFDEVHSNTISTKTLAEVNGAYDNLQNITSTSNITGKSAKNQYKLVTKFYEEQRKYITSLLLSPKVEMYVHTEPFNEIDDAKFIGVILNDGSYNMTNKHSIFKMEVNITLPEVFTQTF